MQQPPITRREDVVETVSGIPVADPYRWLEGGASAEVKEWIAAQNAYAEASLRGDSQRAFADELAKNFETTMFSCPVPAAGRYFYTERRPGEDQRSLYVRKGLDGAPVKLVDPNGRKADNTVSLDFWMSDPKGTRVAYGLSEGGDEMATLRVLDVDAGKDLPDEISQCRSSSLQWLPDGSGFFYTRHPRPGTVPKGEEHLHEKAFFHMLGTDAEKDPLIFGEGRPKDDMITLQLSRDARMLAIHVSREWTENEIYLYDVARKEVRPMITGVPAKFDLVFLEDRAIMRTNYGADTYRILWTPFAELDAPLDQWKELVPAREHLLDESFGVTKDRIVLCYLANAAAQMKLIDHEGNDKGDVPLPPCASIRGIGARRAESEFFYSVESFTFPPMLYRYDPAMAAFVPYRKVENPINPDEYEAKQEWFASKDGTRVPMFIFHRKDAAMHGAVPTILYGYGGFGLNEEPGFMPNWIPWISRGGIFAVANIRGGAEFGERWHLDAIKERKQNSFDDFIAAAEHLIARGYADAAHLGILGGSNGGLLVAACVTQRPELFGAACARVPLTDMVRFPKFGMAMRWVHEYGDPQNPADLRNILAWSPYHNVREGTEYPAMLFMTGEKDTRVDPLHARKMAAALQAVNRRNPVYVYTETEAGHGAGKPVAKIVDTQSLTIEFFAKKLGLREAR